MMKRILFFCVSLLILTSYLKAQTFTDSNLPIVIINIDNSGSIPDEPKVLGNMKIIYKGDGVRNYLTDQNDISTLDYNGRIGIEVRGSSSQSLEKKQYSLTTLKSDNTTNNNVSLLGMPKENDWVLNGLAFDPSLIRDYISYTLSRKIGEYAPRTQYCEVVINGDYRGLYVLQEKIKVDNNRVDIIKISSTDNATPDVTGGYITKADKVAGQDVPAWTMSSYLGANDVAYIHEFPKPSDVTSQQSIYIQGQFFKLSNAVNNTSFADGYPSVIDIPSFVDFMLINELAANVDAYQFSTFFHKDRNGKLRAGPLWDLNLTYGNDLFFWGLDRSHTNTWQFDNGDNVGSRFWKDLFNNSQFKCYLSKRWNELKQSGQPLNIVSLNTLIDETVSIISEAAAREQTRWGTVGDHPTQISNIKNFLSSRITWMTSNLGSFSACNNVQTPNLVVTKINYHPSTSDDFPDSDKQEFIEITNAGNTQVALTGVYFSGVGFVYQFPINSFIPANGVLQLASNRETFQQQNGYLPFGEYTHNLSNSSQKLTLADGFGNVIDEVEYSDENPWPDADGNGSYLKLSDVNLDNADGSNWVASSDEIETNIITGINEQLQTVVEVYPNPTQDKILISVDGIMNSIQLQDAQGKLLESFPVHASSYTLPMDNYSKGIYLLRITVNGKLTVKKIVKI